ncbi:MTOR-associated protein MEAK7 isoform X5 [Calonectris borealis]|uniref:MTOR-associated protein MEAK7 isoform X5 n=1 Tax=Calonectris borealis TaxID=1323832 RepID=UPI003F4B26FB
MFYSASHHFYIVTPGACLPQIDGKALCSGDCHCGHGGIWDFRPYCGTVRSMPCCSREKGRACGPDNTKKLISVMQVENMGNAESNAYQNHLSRFLPEEQSDIDGVFDTLSGSRGSAGAKSGKATKKTVTLAALQAYMREPLPEQMTVRLCNGMKSIDLTGKSSGLSEQIAKEQFVIFMSNLLKGNADEKITIIMRMISKTEGPVKGKQIQEFTEDLIMSVVHVLSYRKELKGWNLENTRDSASGVKALASQLLSELKLADGTKPVGPQLMETNFDQSVIEDWVYRVPQISVFLSVVIRQGDNRCFLFSVFPSLAVYTYTGYNDHYMYLNHGQQTMPNGLGMGGQHGYFGLWIDSDYGKGHSKAKPRCTTYNSPQLSAKEDFTLDAMEVWAVGDLPESAGTKGKKSILDIDPEAQALLEMAGKSRQSEGLREPIEEDDDDDDN